MKGGCRGPQGCLELGVMCKGTVLLVSLSMPSRYMARRFARGWAKTRGTVHELWRLREFLKPVSLGPCR